ADIDIGRCESIAADIVTQRQELVDRRDGLVEIAVAEHALALLRDLPAHRLAGNRRFERPGGIEQPAIIIGLLVSAWAKPGLRKHVGEISADRGAFGDDMPAVLDRRDFAERVDREIALALHLIVANDYGLVRLTHCFDHPAV